MSDMSAQPSELTLEVRPSKQRGYVLSLEGKQLKVPTGWALLKPGDAALSRRIKKDGPSWTIKEPKGIKLFSKGILAPADRIEALMAILEDERKDPAYERKLEAGRKRRAKDEAEYRITFQHAIHQFLNFHPSYTDLADDLSSRITEHAVPVGSGTVARTKMIPIEQRAEAATIAWMRHQTTSYDNMTIPKEKGKRREVRRMLAERSRKLLNAYREGSESHLTTCPLYKALN